MRNVRHYIFVIHIDMLTGKENETLILLFPSKFFFFFNLLAVIYDNKFLKLVLGDVCKVSYVSHRQ